MRQETINKILKHLNSIKDSKITIKQYEDTNKLYNGFIYNYIAKVKSAYKYQTIEQADYDTIMSLYSSIIDKSPDAKETDNRAQININRDENGRISSYGFTIYVKDKEPIVGQLSRDEMALIYRLYSSYGSNITQREVSRFFPEYSLCDFKRILRTFSITKASAPFPPHIVEEKSKEELLDMQFREKENDFLRSYEVEKVKQLDGQLKKYMKENADLKEQLNSFSDIKVNLSDLDIAIPQPTKSSSDLLIYLSDMHIGAEVGNNSLYNNTYNKEEVIRRLDKVFCEVYSISGYDNIVVCNAGDSLDGMYNQTTRTGHYLPQNMSDKEQIKCFLECMSGFFIKLSQMPHNNIKYYAVGESNHGGIYEYASQVALSGILGQLGVECTIFDKFLGTFELKGVNFLLSHGKDDKEMFKNWPLVLNDKTESIINEYLDSKGIGNAIVIKGDLHQSAITYGKRIKYHSVGSLFGSSGWIMKNFGNTKAACDYSIMKDGQIIDGRVILN